MCDVTCDHGSHCMIGPPFHVAHHSKDGCYIFFIEKASERGGFQSQKETNGSRLSDTLSPVAAKRSLYEGFHDGLGNEL